VSEAFQPALDFEAVERAAEVGEALVLDLDGYEGPLHLLLALARSQKVDLLRISVARLAEQYIAFVEGGGRRFELAAEYLVMAAWLAYLKSRLLLPKSEPKGGDQPPVEELAEALAFRLAKLDAMRTAAEALRSRPQLGRDVFTRGGGKAAWAPAAPEVREDLYGLMAAYASARLRPEPDAYRPAPRVEAFGLEAARDRLRAWLPRLQDWTPLERVAPRLAGPEAPSRASCVASTFAAGLEMTKEGALELRQTDAFAPLYLRAPTL
jgi:segregation and condensation protein A